MKYYTPFELGVRDRRRGMSSAANPYHPILDPARADEYHRGWLYMNERMP